MAATSLRPLKLLAQHYDDQSVMLLEQPTPLGYQSYTILETTYGLQLAIYETTSDDGDIAFLDGQRNQVDIAKRPCSPSSTQFRFHPEWMIRYDEACREDPDDPYVGEDIVRARHPALEPFFLSWEKYYDIAAQRRDCRMRYVWEAVPDVRVRVAWEMKWFLLACWLVLQGIGSISYKSHDIAKYDIQPNGVDLALRRFLRDMDALIVYKDSMEESEYEESGQGCSVC